MAEPFRDIEEASKRARVSYFWFTIFGFHLALVAGATTHEQLIRGTAMTMPTLQVGLPIKGFYVIVPPILVLRYVQLLYYLKALADKIASGDLILLSAGGRETGTHIGDDLPDLVLVERVPESGHITPEEFAAVSDRPEQVFIDPRGQACQMDQQGGWREERHPSLAPAPSAYVVA